MVESIRKLKKICEYTRGDSPLNRLFYRKISIYFTKLFLMIPLSANAVSVLSGIAGLPSIFFFGIGGYINSIIGSLSLFLWYVLDCSDGQVARYSKKINIKGSYVDEVFGIIEWLVFVGMSFGNYDKLGFLSFVLGFSIIVSMGFSKTLNLTKKNLVHKSLSENNIVRKIYETFKFSFHASTTILLILLGALINILHYVFLFYGIIFPIYVLGIIIYQMRTKWED